MTINLDALERLAQAATPGPWTVCKHLEGVEADLACTCGYRGVVFGPDHDIPMAVCQPGHDPEPEGEEGLGPQSYSRDVQIADSQWIAAANPAAILELVAEVRRLREERRQAILDAERAREERNRVGMETRREWMAKCEALRIERDALFTACRNAILPLAYAAQRDPTYQREYESLSAVIDCARAKDQP